MARKKKSEPVPEEPIEEPVIVPEEQKEEDACFIPFENGMPDGPTSSVEYSITSEEAGTSKTISVPVEGSESVGHNSEYIKKIGHAFEVIEKCNLYMWAGLDWGTGRIYEMSRKEWANYIIAMYEWSDGGFVGIEPVMPSEVKYD